MGFCVERDGFKVLVADMEGRVGNRSFGDGDLWRRRSETAKAAGDCFTQQIIFFMFPYPVKIKQMELKGKNSKNN